MKLWPPPWKIARLDAVEATVHARALRDLREAGKRIDALAAMALEKDRQIDALDIALRDAKAAAEATLSRVKAAAAELAVDIEGRDERIRNLQATIGQQDGKLQLLDAIRAVLAIGDRH